MNRRRSTLTAAAILGAGAVAVGVLPALAHPSFPAQPAFGFQPNPTGGEGRFGEPPAYAPGSTNTLQLFVPGEQTEPFQGRDDTTVSVTVSIPSGWTAPTCGPASTEVISAGTSGTSQPGTPVAGWTCTTLGGGTSVRWSGPQVPAGKTQVDAAQYFALSVTAPSPAQQTTYDGLNGTQGFAVDQLYAGGKLDRWIPSVGYAGGGIVADGLARTVAGTSATTPAPSASATPSPSVSATPTASPTATPTSTPTSTPTAPPTGTPAPSPTCGTTATPAARYVQYVFSTVLGRCAEPAAESRFSTALTSGSLSRLGLARSVELSQENVALNEVATAYRDLVGRTPGATESAAWVRAVTRAQTDRPLRARLLASAELYDAARPSPCAMTNPDPSTPKDDLWLASAYCQAFGRLPDAAGAASWKRLLGASSTEASRLTVADGLLRSSESAARTVRATYTDVLRRDAGADEVSRGADHLRTTLRGRTLELTAQVLASDEAYGIAQR